MRFRSADSQELAALPTKHEQSSQNPRSALRDPKFYWLLAGVLLAAAAFGVYRLNGQRQTRGGAAAVPFSEISVSRLTTSGKTTHAAISPDGEYVAHVTVDTEGDSLWVRHVAAPASVRVAGPAATKYVAVTFAPDGDSIYYLALDRNDGLTSLRRVAVLGGPSSTVLQDVGPVSFSPDGNRIAYVRSEPNGESRLVLANPDGTDRRVLASRMLPEFFQFDWKSPVWSPDGKTIACQATLQDERGRYETVVGVSVEDGSQRPLAKKRWHHTGQSVWLADGTGLLLTASESATSPAQIWHIAREGGEERPVTRDLNDYQDIGLTRDGRELVAVQNHYVSNIWVAPAGDASRAKQIASEVGLIGDVAWTPDGRIVYRSNAGGGAEIWAMNADGSNQKQLTSDARVFRGLSVSPDGRYIFFASDRAGQFNIWRADADGSNLKQLTDGEGDYFPHPTPDGRWVVFQRGKIEPKLWKAPAEGGGAVQLTETRVARPAVSHDGTLVAYHFLDPEAEGSRWRIGVVSIAGGPPLKRFDFPPTVAPAQRLVRWAPDRRSIAYANSPGGLSDIWAQPLDGGRPRRLTDFRAEQIIAFDWSADGRTILFVRGVETSDVVLIENAALKK